MSEIRGCEHTRISGRSPTLQKPAAKRAFVVLRVTIAKPAPKNGARVAAIATVTLAAANGQGINETRLSRPLQGLATGIEARQGRDGYRLGSRKPGPKGSPVDVNAEGTRD